MTLDRRPDASLRRVGSSTRTAVRNILAHWDRATASDIEAGAQWYGEAGAIVDSLATRAGSREHAAAVLSHLSPRTTWARNVAGATALILSGEAPTCLTANIARARKALDSTDPLGTLNGPKTKRFARNILGDTEAVTIDVWAARVAGIDHERDLDRVGVYDALEHAYRLAARRRGVSPTTMQATTWIVARNDRAT